MDVIWKPVVDYESLYRVSNQGEIMRIDTNFIKKPCIHKSGYATIALSRNSIEKTYLVHRLVMAAFVGIPKKGITVNHKDGKKANNSLENLEYLSYSDNHKHAFRVLKRKQNPSNRKLTDIQIKEIRIVADKIPLAQIARLLNVHVGTISKIIHKYSWKELQG